MDTDTAWPSLPWNDWRDSCEALRLWCQIVGKYRLARTPWINHSWHATFYVTPRGLTTGPVPDGAGAISVSFDFDAAVLAVEASDGRGAEFLLEPMAVADFHARFRDAIETVGGNARFNGRSNEIEPAIPFAEDRAARPFDLDAVRRFHAALISVERVFTAFRTGYLGKVSPVHLFWGSFDLAVTRFSGRRAPLHPGGILNLPDAVTREAYSHEVSSAGFWPGGAGADEAMFYSYAYAAPPGFAGRPVEPGAARFDTGLGEYLLPYEAVRTAADPEAALMAFLQSTYAAAADAGGWDRAALECDLGRPGKPRPIATA